MQSINKSVDESTPEVIPNIVVHEDVSHPVVLEDVNHPVVGKPPLESLTLKKKPRCQGITKSGDQCKSQGSCGNNIYCKRHNTD